MPRILVFGQYVLFFWIAENGEPVHIHVGVKRAAANSTKFWLTKNGGCTLANNESKIPAKDLRDLSKLITMNHRIVLARKILQLRMRQIPLRLFHLTALCQLIMQLSQP